MDVSVVIPLYNKVRHIKRALDSVLAQTFRDSEVVVVNDGSTDGSGEVVKRCTDPRIRLITQENAGVSAARNRGISEARGEVIAFLDADDEWLPEHLETILRLRGKYPQCGAYATAYEIIESDGRRKANRFAGTPAPPWEGVVPNYFRTSIESANNIVCSSAVAIPKAVFDRVGYFPVGVSRGEDIDLWCRIALRYPIAFSSQLGAVYYRGNENSLGNRRPDCLTLQLFESLRDACRSGDLPSGTSRYDVMEFYNKAHISHALQFVVLGDYHNARKYLNKVSSTRKFRFRWLYWYARTFIPMPVVVMLRSVRKLVKGRAT